MTDPTPSRTTSALAPVTLPGPAAAMLAARCPEARLARVVEPTFGLGLVLPLLAQTAPFSRAPLGLRVPLTAGELARGHHLLVVRARQVVAYAGWAACTEAEGQGFLGAEGIAALDFSRREGDAIAFLTWVAVDRSAMAALRTGMRALYPRQCYFARRSRAPAADASGEARPVVPRGGIITPLSWLGGSAAA